MNKLHYSQSSTALFLTLALTTATVTPIFSGQPAQAQLFPANRTQVNNYANVTIPLGTKIPVEYKEAEKILVAKDETMPLTVTVAANIRDRRGTLLIPYGTKISGKIEPSGNGARFVAEELTFTNQNQNQSQTINGNSKTVTKTETIRRGTNTNSILKGAAIGGAAAAIIAAITGDRAIATEEVLGGAGAGVLASILLGRRQVEVISFNTNSDLELTLRSDLSLNLSNNVANR